jgi:DNA-binding transcriptional LysR family regulator
MDAVIGVGDGNWPGMVSHHLLDEVLVPVISPALAAKRQLCNPADMQDHILLRVSTRLGAWNQWFETYNQPTKNMRLGPAFELTSHLIQAAVAGIGVGLVPICLVEDELRNGSLVTPFDATLDTRLGYYLFVPPHRVLPPSLTALKDWLLTLKSPELPLGN